MEQYQISINYEGNDYCLIVPDLETANMLLNDQEAAFQYLRHLDPETFALPPSVSNENVENVAGTQQELIWTKRKPSSADLEATTLLLSARQNMANVFDDKKTTKNKLWNQIAKEIHEQGYNVGENGGERCRQKFANLQKLYLKYINHQKTSGEGATDPPPFFDEMHSILGMKHKTNPLQLEDSFVDENAGLVGIEEVAGPSGVSLRSTPMTSTAPSTAPSTSTASALTITEHPHTDRFKRNKKKLKPVTKTEQILAELKKDGEMQKQQFAVLEKHLTKADEQRERFLNILEKAFSKKRQLDSSDSD